MHCWLLDLLICLAFCLVEPFFIQAALEGQILLREQLPTLLQAPDTQIYVTRCILNDLSKLGPSFRGSATIAQQFQRATCNHPGTLTTKECILSMIGIDITAFLDCVQ